MVALPRSSPNLAAKVTWKFSSEKETFTPLRSGLVHFCLGYSYKHIGVRKSFLQDHLKEVGSSLEQKDKCEESGVLLVCVEFAT